jgi:hypothetical protein
LEFELKFVKIWHTTGGKWTKSLNIPRKFEMKNVENFHFLNLKWKKLKICIFGIWNENFHLKIKKMVISLERNEKIWNEEIIYFVLPPR